MSSSTTPLSTDTPPRGTPLNIGKKFLIFLEPGIIDLQFSCAFRKNFFRKSVFQPFKVNQCHWFWCESNAYMWLPISPPQQPWSYLAPFWRYCGFYLLLTHSYSNLILLDQIAHGGNSVSSDLKLFSREIIFQVPVFQPMWSWYLNRRTDRWTYDIQSHNCAQHSIVRQKHLGNASTTLKVAPVFTTTEWQSKLNEWFLTDFWANTISQQNVHLSCVASCHSTPQCT